MFTQSATHVLELPRAWLALLIQHIASGPGGIANAAALSQTCKFMHGLFEGPAVAYSNLFLAAPISSPYHSAWHWLEKRSGRIAGLSLELHATQNDSQLSQWKQPLQILSGISGVQLRVEWDGCIDDVDHPLIAQWLKRHGELISHLAVEIRVSEDRLKLREFVEAAAPCKSIDLTIQHSSSHVVDLDDLDLVAGSLLHLRCTCDWGIGALELGDLELGNLGLGVLRGANALSNMSQLTELGFIYEDLIIEEPWGLLANLTSLQKLYLMGSASGDPSPLSALTRLSYLVLESCLQDPDGQASFSFSSLQPLSTLQQLEEMYLGDKACTSTSLQGLAELSNLKNLAVEAHELISLEGISPTVEYFSMACAPNLVSLAPIKGCTGLKQFTMVNCCISSLEGLCSVSLQSLTLKDCNSLTHLSGVEHLSALKDLEVNACDNVTSLQVLSQLGEGLQELKVYGCKRVQEEVLELPHVQPTADVVVEESSVREVVLAGGVRRAVGSPA
jgi:hypothetical protein